MTASKKRLYQQLAIAALSVIFTLAVLELFCHFTPEGQTILVYPSSIPGVGYQLVPGFARGATGAYEYINQWGFLSPDFPREKPSGTFRIFMVGDSVVFGDVSIGRNMSDTLEFKLNAKSRSASIKHFQVVDTGVPGYATCQELAYLTHYIDTFDPDLIIVGYVMNDPERTHVPFGLDLNTGEIAPWFRVYHWIKQHDAIAKWCVARLSPLVWRLRGGVGNFGPKVAVSDPSFNVKYTLALHDPKGEFWPACAQCIAGLGEYQRTKKIPVLFVVFPILDELHVPELVKVYKQVAETAKKNALPTISLYDHLSKVDAAQMALMQGDGIHPSEKGHIFIADVIYKYLKNHPHMLEMAGKR